MKPYKILALSIALQLIIFMGLYNALIPDPIVVVEEDSDSPKLRMTWNGTIEPLAYAIAFAINISSYGMKLPGLLTVTYSWSGIQMRTEWIHDVVLILFYNVTFSYIAETDVLSFQFFTLQYPATALIQLFW
jgi:hypothetical protein